MQNTISCNNITFKVTRKADKPFGNNFVQLKDIDARIEAYEGTDEIIAYVTCTNNSREPGRIYAVYYSMQGKLIACNTVN